MRTTGGVADRLAPLVRRVEESMSGPLPVSVRFWDGSSIEPDGGAEDTIVVKDKRALSYAFSRPDQVGLARAWVAGDLELEGDMERVLEAGESMKGVSLDLGAKLTALRAAMRTGALRLKPPEPPSSEARVRGRLHSVGRDRDSVRHHYDVSNRFYRMVLGPTMVYSCAYFASPGDTLEQAQERKLDVICRKLRLTEGERMLDIGCGWGSLVMHAAARYGARAVGVTLSEPQAELARERIEKAGLGSSCEIRVADYREIGDGPYDKIASVGMYEHVGAAQLDRYMQTLRALCRPGGLVLNHGIVRLGPRPANRDTFIWRYVFPDGELHQTATVVEAMERAGLELRDSESLREHYTLTLRRWVENLAANRDEAIGEAGDERERIWRLYMTGSALAFDRGEIGLQQLLAAVPGADHPLPLARRASAGD